MKTAILIISFLIGSILCACTHDEILEKESPDNRIEEIQSDESTISQEEAIDIAESFFKSRRGRSSISEKPTVEIIKSKHSSSRSGTDTENTVAYILNYPGNAGFAIISSSKRVYPVLAFSESGNFSLENEIARVNFVDRIEDYIEGNNDPMPNEGESLDGCYEVSPAIQTSISQDAPWNKYIRIQNPLYKVGCVAVATGLVLSHSQRTLNYRGQVFYLNSVITAISEYQNRGTRTGSNKIVGVNPPQPTYTYDEAVDIMAKLLYYIGLDVKMKYGITVSTANSTEAYLLCKKLKLPIIPNFPEELTALQDLLAFDINEVTRLLKDGYIIYLNGLAENSMYGHAWVSDGCYFCVDAGDRNKITETYLHCDWGYGGSGNGYFSGSVFSSTEGNYRPNKYFALKITL